METVEYSVPLSRLQELVGYARTTEGRADAVEIGEYGGTLGDFVRFAQSPEGKRADIETKEYSMTLGGLVSFAKSPAGKAFAERQQWVRLHTGTVDPEVLGYSERPVPLALTSVDQEVLGFSERPVSTIEPKPLGGKAGVAAKIASLPRSTRPKSIVQQLENFIGSIPKNVASRREKVQNIASTPVDIVLGGRQGLLDKQLTKMLGTKTLLPDQKPIDIKTNVGTLIEAGLAAALPIAFPEMAVNLIGAAGINIGVAEAVSTLLPSIKIPVLGTIGGHRFLTPEQAVQAGLVGEVGYIAGVSAADVGGALWKRLPSGLTDPVESAAGFVKSIPSRAVEYMPSPIPEFTEYLGNLGNDIGFQFRQNAPQSLLNLVYGKETGTLIGFERAFPWTEEVFGSGGYEDIPSAEAFGKWKNLWRMEPVTEAPQEDWFVVTHGEPQTPMAVTLNKLLQKSMPTEGMGGLSAIQELITKPDVDVSEPIPESVPNISGPDVTGEVEKLLGSSALVETGMTLADSGVSLSKPINKTSPETPASLKPTVTPIIQPFNLSKVTSVLGSREEVVTRLGTEEDTENILGSGVAGAIRAILGIDSTAGLASFTEQEQQLIQEPRTIQEYGYRMDVATESEYEQKRKRKKAKEPLFLLNAFRATPSGSGIEERKVLAHLERFFPVRGLKQPKTAKGPQEFFRAAKIGGVSGIGEFRATRQFVQFYPKSQVRKSRKTKRKRK
jgi:hypothetical protein